MNLRIKSKNYLSLWCAFDEKDMEEDSGHEQTQLFKKSFDASLRNTLAINHTLEKMKDLSKEKTMQL